MVKNMEQKTVMQGNAKRMTKLTNVSNVFKSFFAPLLIILLMPMAAAQNLSGNTTGEALSFTSCPTEVNTSVLLWLVVLLSLFLITIGLFLEGLGRATFGALGGSILLICSFLISPCFNFAGFVVALIAALLVAYSIISAFQKKQ